MTRYQLVFFLEGETERIILESLMNRISKEYSELNCDCQYISFKGKQNLIKRLPLKLKGWNDNTSTRFIILLDKDNEDCKKLKNKIIGITNECDKTNRSLIRISCQEIESWFFGDLKAVERGLNIENLYTKNVNKKKYRNPDTIDKPSKELVNITSNRYEKIKGSRLIAPYLSIENDINHSRSYNVFISGIRNILNSF